MDQDVEHSEIVEVLLKHLPKSRQKVRKIDDSWITRADVYAWGLSSALDYKYYLKSVGWDAVEMERLARLLNQSLASMGRIHPRLLGGIRWFDDVESDKKKILSDGHDFQALVEEARDMFTQAQKYLSNLRPESQKRNWLAVSVVRECRHVWGEEHWAMKYGEWGEGADYEEHMEKFPPKTQNHYRPGPFGRFVEDVFETCHVLNETGAVVSAATALESLQSFENQEDYVKRFGTS